MDQAMSDTAWGDAASKEVDADEADTSGAAEAAADDSGGITGEAARSAFDALFADGASSWGSAFLAKPKPEDSISGAKEDAADDLYQADLGDPLSTTRGDDDTEDGSDRPKRKRSRNLPASC